MKKKKIEYAEQIQRPRENLQISNGSRERREPQANGVTGVGRRPRRDRPTFAIQAGSKIYA